MDQLRPTNFRLIYLQEMKGTILKYFQTSVCHIQIKWYISYLVLCLWIHEFLNGPNGSSGCQEVIIE